MNYEIILRHPEIQRLSEGRAGLLCNHTAWNPESGRYLFEILPGLKRLFLPEHGLFAELQDQIPLTDTGVYRSVGLNAEIESLYGDSENSLEADPKSLRDLDVIFLDIQDVGSRYYTFATTVSYLFSVISRNSLDISVVLLDRENPAGLQVEGSVLPEHYQSFVGRPGLVHRHGLTMAELSVFYYKDLQSSFPLYIVPLKEEHLRDDLQNILPGSIHIVEAFTENNENLTLTNPVYSSILQTPEDIYYTDTWMIAPSPNMPGPVTPLVYSGQCLLEGTNLSEGRGTTRPFEIFGAPYLKLTESLRSNELFMKFPGSVMRPLRFLPVFHKWKEEICDGFQIHLTGRPYHSLLHTLVILRTVRELFPDDFRLREGPYEFRSDLPALTLLAGDDLLTDFVSGKADQESVRSHLYASETAWLEEIKKYKIYSRKNFIVSGK